MSSEEITIQKLLHRIIDPDEIARSHAANIFYNKVIASGLHPTDIRVLLSNNPEINEKAETFAFIEDLKSKINKQDREIEYLRRHVDPKFLDAALKAGTIRYRWGELEELIRSRITGDDPESHQLTKGWKTDLMEILRVGAGTIRRWHEGVELIPEIALDTLRARPLAPRRDKADRAKAGRSGARRSSPRPRSDFQWTKDIYLSALDLLRSGKGAPATAKAIGVPMIGKRSSGIVDGKFTNSPPAELWLGNIPIFDSGPMSYLELWKIAHALYGQKWRGDNGIAGRFKLLKGVMSYNDPGWMTEEQCNELRREYHARKAREERQSTRSERIKPTSLAEGS